MKELVLDLITSYENRISAVEELVTATYQSTASPEIRFGDIDREREQLRNSLQKTLAKNCSLRKKDFDNLMASVLSASEKKREEIEAERKRVVEKVKEYLDEQKELALSLKQQWVELVEEKAADGLEMLLSRIKTTYQDTGQRLFATLRDFQANLEVLQEEQEGLNRQLQRLVERGESLSIEDLRQLEASKAGQERRAARELRREEVERLLAHFKQQRQESSRQ